MSTFGDFMIGQAVEKNQEVDRLRTSNRELLAALKKIAEHMDADDSDSYRADDPEGAMDTVHAIAIRAIAGTNSGPQMDPETETAQSL